MFKITLFDVIMHKLDDNINGSEHIYIDYQKAFFRGSKIGLFRRFIMMAQNENRFLFIFAVR